jgi:hypothetical protein
LAHPPRLDCAPNRVECKSAFSLQKSAGYNDADAALPDGRLGFPHAEPDDRGGYRCRYFRCRDARRRMIANERSATAPMEFAKKQLPGFSDAAHA